jgi:hypothetical protein
MPGIPTTVIHAVLKFADKENPPTGLTFRNRHNESFNFSNDDIDDILFTRPMKAAPFPDIANELPGPMAVTPVTLAPEQPATDRDELAIRAANNAVLAIRACPFNTITRLPTNFLPTSHR